MSRKLKRRIYWYAFIACSALIVGVFLFRVLDRFAGAGHDDTFITLLAAEQLAAGQGFVNFNGAPAEIGSSLLHVLLLATIKLSGLGELFLANKVFGVACGSATLVLVLLAHRRFFPGAGVAGMAAAVCAALMSASLPSYLFWSVGGLETPLVALLLVSLTVQLAARNSQPLYIGIVAALLGLSRPEGFVYLGAIALVGIVRRSSPRWYGWAVALPAGALVVTALLRATLIGASLPVPALAKAQSADPFARLGEGVGYLAAFLKASDLSKLLVAGYIVRVLLLISKLSRLRGRVTTSSASGLAGLAVVTVAGIHLISVVVAGGDWMAFYRFVAPAVPLLGVATAQVLLAALQMFPETRRLSAGITACTVLTVAAWPMAKSERSGLQFPHMGNTSMQRSLADLLDERLGATLGDRLRHLNHPHWRDLSQLDPFLSGPLRDLADQAGTLVLVTAQMGYLPYRLRELNYQKRVHLIDAYGITDPEIAALPGKRAARGLRDGEDPLRFLDPRSGSALAHLIARREPHVLYMLRVDRKRVLTLAAQGWRMIWNAPEAKVFVRKELLKRLQESGSWPVANRRTSAN